jgi:hypothetical protein
VESVSILIDHTLSHFPVFLKTCLVSLSDWPGGSNGTVGWSVVQLGHGKGQPSVSGKSHGSGGSGGSSGPGESVHLTGWG